MRTREHRYRRHGVVIQRLLNRALLTPQDAARELGISPGKMELYCTGTVGVPRIVRLALKQVARQELARANRLLDELLESGPDPH